MLSLQLVKLKDMPADFLQIFPELIKGTGLKTEFFELSGQPIFGHQEFLLKANKKAIKKFRKAQNELKKRIESLYNSNTIRYGSWG